MTTAVEATLRARLRGGGLMIAAAGIFAAGAGLMAACVGAVSITPDEIAAIVAARFGLIGVDAIDPTAQAVFETIRVPRIFLGFLAGAALALAGAALQGVFRNPLADPALIGVSPGAALGAVGVIVLGPQLAPGLSAQAHVWQLPLAAFACGLAATAIVYLVSRDEGRVVVSSMLLAGVAVGAMAMAGVGWLGFLATDDQLRMLTFWTLGSVGAASWPALGPAALLVAAASIVLTRLARPLDALALGEDGARHLGFDPDRTARTAAFAAAVAVGAATALCGVIGFVGLIAPHLVRLIAGPAHRVVLPASALSGGGLVVLADTIARSAAAPSELPLGVVTALIGGPFFFWLILREKRRALA